MENYYSLEKIMAARQTELLAEAEHEALVNQAKQPKIADRMHKSRENKLKLRWWPFSSGNRSYI